MLISRLIRARVSERPGVKRMLLVLGGDPPIRICICKGSQSTRDLHISVVICMASRSILGPLMSLVWLSLIKKGSARPSSALLTSFLGAVLIKSASAMFSTSNFSHKHHRKNRCQMSASTKLMETISRRRLPAPPKPYPVISTNSNSTRTRYTQINYRVRIRRKSLLSSRLRSSLWLRVSIQAPLSRYLNRLINNNHCRTSISSSYSSNRTSSSRCLRDQIPS